jgi:MoxR-like ATPase
MSHDVRALNDMVKAESAFVDELMHEITKVIVGQTAMVERVVIGLLTGGHVLLEGVPGLGKTMLVRTMAEALELQFSRIQFTPDMMPADIIGTTVIDEQAGGGHKSFSFRKGPIFANIVLADEINRASPKTQASLLECMEEQQATIDSVTHPIVAPFMVIATQNPVEYEGTYPLPEAQLDRFMMRLGLGYPSADAEESILHEQTSRDPFADLGPVIDTAEVLAMQRAVRRVNVVPALRRYVVNLLTATRSSRDIYLGASPRAGIALLRAAKALALLRGRDYVVPQDLKDLAERVLGHLIILSSDARVHGQTESAVIAGLLRSVSVPGA